MAKKLDRTLRNGRTWCCEKALALLAYIIIEMGLRGYQLPQEHHEKVLVSIQGNLELYKGRGAYNDRERLKQYMKDYVEKGHTGMLPDAMLYLDYFEKIDVSNSCASGECKCRAAV